MLCHFYQPRDFTKEMKTKGLDDAESTLSMKSLKGVKTIDTLKNVTYSIFNKHLLHVWYLQSHNARVFANIFVVEYLQYIITKCDTDGAISRPNSSSVLRATIHTINYNNSRIFGSFLRKCSQCSDQLNCHLVRIRRFSISYRQISIASYSLIFTS